VELKSCGRPEAWGDEASWKVNSAHESLHTDVSSIFVLNKYELILSLYYKIDKKCMYFRGLSTWTCIKYMCVYTLTKIPCSHSMTCGATEIHLMLKPHVLVKLSRLCNNSMLKDHTTTQVRVNCQPPTAGNGPPRKQVLIIEPLFFPWWATISHLIGSEG